MKSNAIVLGATLVSAMVASAHERTAPDETWWLDVPGQAVIVEGQPVKVVRVPLETKVVTDAPYTAEVVFESLQVLPDGNRIASRSTGRVYRDSQGRVRREDDAEPGRVRSISITDPVASVAYSLDPESKTAWTTPMVHAHGIVAKAVPIIAGTAAGTGSDPVEVELQKKVQAEHEKQAQIESMARAGATGAHAGGVVASAELRRQHEKVGGEMKVEQLPARLLEGVMAEGTRTTRTVPAGAIGNEQPIVTVTEEWHSPDLQILVMTRTSDPRTGESTYKLLNITRAEPSQSWFEVPADYTVKETGVRRVAEGVGRRR